VIDELRDPTQAVVLDRMARLETSVKDI